MTSHIASSDVALIGWMTLLTIVLLFLLISAIRALHRSTDKLNEALHTVQEIRRDIETAKAVFQIHSAFTKAAATEQAYRSDSQ